MCSGRAKQGVSGRRAKQGVCVVGELNRVCVCGRRAKQGVCVW